ncbi:MAG TPA: hypothetical protein VFZ97_06200 [Acidimicrobiales bacterium]
MAKGVARGPTGVGPSRGLSRRTVLKAAGVGATAAWVTPVVESFTLSAAAVSGPVRACTATVTLPNHVRGTASPAAMADRIPPRVDTTVTVVVNGLNAQDPPIILSIVGGAGDGTATIDGGGTRILAANGTFMPNLRGVTQTEAGRGPKLILIASQGGSRCAMTPPFAVSAIPLNYTESFDSLVTGTRRGIVVQDGWSSDSGNIADLDQCDISEEVQPISGTGCFGVGPSDTSGYLPGNSPSKDTHSTGTAILTSTGTRVVNQTCKFRDKRSISTDIPMTNSGYTVTRTVIAKAGGGFQITTTKQGANVTANGTTSNAGATTPAGGITRTQDV